MDVFQSGFLTSANKLQNSCLVVHTGRLGGGTVLRASVGKSDLVYSTGLTITVWPVHDWA